MLFFAIVTPMEPWISAFLRLFVFICVLWQFMPANCNELSNFISVDFMICVVC